MSKIFISHSSLNNAHALAVGHWLKDNGWDDMFLDIEPARGLAPGERWQEALKKAADRCEAVLFLISPAWRDSKWCLAEFLLAKQLGKTIFGVLVEATPFDTLPMEMTAEWQLCDLVTGAERKQIHVHADPLVPPTDVSLASVGFTRLKIGLQKSGLDPTTFPWPPKDDPKRAPYRGLKALEAEDAAIFFGRDAAIVRALDKLRTMREQGIDRLCVILGASGSGKSSFLRAGLWPRLKRDDHHFLPLPVIRPEQNVITGPAGLVASLEAALSKLNHARNRADIRKVLEQSNGFEQILMELQSVAHERFGSDAVPTKPSTIVLSVDQGEELFGAEGREEAERFMSILGTVLAPPTGNDKAAIASRNRILAIVAIRSDSYDRLQTEPPLNAFTHVPFNLPPLARAEYKMVIEGPARVVTNADRTLNVKPDLTEQLLQEAEGADALPLLAFTLERLFLEYGSDGDLRLDEYISPSFGGIRGAIEGAVAAAFANPDKPPIIPREQGQREQLLRKAFIPWLAKVDPETGLAMRRVAQWGKIPTEYLGLLQRLIDARLLVKDRRRLTDEQHEVDVVEVAHEALLRQWPILTAWLKEDGELLQTEEGVLHAANDWDKHHRIEAWLTHRGPRLSLALSLEGRPDFQELLGDKGHAYLIACRVREALEQDERQKQLERTARMQRRVAWLLGSVTVILIAGTFGTVLQMRKVGQQTSLVLADEARRATDVGNLDRALRLAVLAARNTWLSPSSKEAEPQLARAAQASAMIAQFKHEDSIHSPTFNREGTLALTASDDGTARLWEVATGKERARFQHEGSVNSAAFNREGTLALTASDDGTARLWEVATGKERARFQHEGSVNSAVFNPDETLVLTASRDQTARLWQVATGQELAKFQHDDSVTFATLSPDGRKIVTTSRDKTAQIWEVRTRKRLFLLKHDDIVFEAIFSPDGRQFATTSLSHVVRLYAVESGKELANFRPPPRGDSVAFSHDGQKIVIAQSSDNSARVWEVATGKELMQFKHNASVSSATFSPNDKLVVTATGDGTARLWEVETAKELARFQHDNSHKYHHIRSADFSSDGRRVVTTSADYSVRVWDAGNSMFSLKHGLRLDLANFSPDGTKVVTLADSSIAQMWETKTGKKLPGFVHNGLVRSAVFSSNGTRILTAANDNTARLWEVVTGKELARFQHNDKVSSAVFTHDETLVLTVSDDGTARLWNIATGNEFVRFEHEESLRSATVSPDGKLVVSVPRHGPAYIWKVASPSRPLPLIRHEDFIFSAKFNPDSTKIVTASMDSTVRLWKADTGEQIFERPHKSLWFADFSPDGQRIVSTSSGEAVKIWDVATMKELATLQHGGAVRTATFNRDSTLLLTASDDRTARLWEVSTWTELARFIHDARIESASFSHDDTMIVTASADRTARLWEVHWPIKHHGGALIDRVCREKLIGAHLLTSMDLNHSLMLTGHEKEDVCDPPSIFSHIVTRLGAYLHRSTVSE
ncbi:MAG: TIR domain-containing protein [Nitrospira sp.]